LVFFAAAPEHLNNPLDGYLVFSASSFLGSSEVDDEEVNPNGHFAFLTTSVG